MTKVKLHGNLFVLTKKGITSSSKTLNISDTDTSLKEETEKNDSGVNKTADEQGTEGSHKKIYILFKKR